MKTITKYTGVLLSFLSISAHASTVKDDETVILFSTSGYMGSDNQWIIPVHGWIFEYEHDSLWRKSSLKVLMKSLELNGIDANNAYFKKRAWHFLVDNERGKKVSVAIAGESFQCDKSRPNGHFKGVAELNFSVLPNHNNGGWINYEVKLKKDDKRKFIGETQLLPKQGISVISDIDDTIKASHVADKAELLKNTFLKAFQAVDGMATIYQQWHKSGAAFHYLSASPWQLYQSLSAFTEENNFPRGDFHLRNFRIKDSSFYALFKSPFEYKTGKIENIIKNYPQRKFVLVGDSTESDPEIYAHIAKKYPQQIIKIFIRQADTPSNKERFVNTFSELENNKWQVFSEAKELGEVKLEDF